MGWWSGQEQVACKDQDKQGRAPEATTGSQGYVESKKWIFFAPSDVQVASLRAGCRRVTDQGFPEVVLTSGGWWSAGKLWKTCSQLDRKELELRPPKIAPCA